MLNFVTVKPTCASATASSLRRPTRSTATRVTKYRPDDSPDSRPASSSLRSMIAEVVFGSSTCKVREQRPAASCAGSRSPAQSSSRSTPLAASTNRSHVTVTEVEFAPPSHTTSSVLNVYSTRRSAPPIGGIVSYSTGRCVCAVLLRPRASAHVKLANTKAPSWIASLSDVSVATPLKPVSVVWSIRMGRSSAASSSSSCSTSPDGPAETTIASNRSRPPCAVPSESFPDGATPVALCRQEKRTRRAGPALDVFASSTSTVTRTSGGEVSSSTGDPVAFAQRAAGRADVGLLQATTNSTPDAPETTRPVVRSNSLTRRETTGTRLASRLASSSHGASASRSDHVHGWSIGPHVPSVANQGSPIVSPPIRSVASEDATGEAAPARLMQRTSAVSTVPLASAVALRTHVAGLSCDVVCPPSETTSTPEPAAGWVAIKLKVQLAIPLCQSTKPFESFTTTVTLSIDAGYDCCSLYACGSLSCTRTLPAWGGVVSSTNPSERAARGSVGTAPFHSRHLIGRAVDVHGRADGHLSVAHLLIELPRVVRETRVLITEANPVGACQCAAADVRCASKVGHLAGTGRRPVEYGTVAARVCTVGAGAIDRAHAAKVIHALAEHRGRKCHATAAGDGHRACKQWLPCSVDHPPRRAHP
eukprot:scaffold52888_cov70-Phaeocystis_antarctica.AAC.8